MDSSKKTWSSMSKISSKKRMKKAKSKGLKNKAKRMSLANKPHILDDSPASLHENLFKHNKTVKIFGNFYFGLLTDLPVDPPSSVDYYFFSIDNELIYDNFFDDFGPLNIAQVVKYCRKVNTILQRINKRKVIHVTQQNQARSIANSAWLIGAYCILEKSFSPLEAYQGVKKILPPGKEFESFRDAATGAITFPLDMLACFTALHKALKYDLFNYNSFDVEEYEHYERVENGDFNWITPKFLAFCGPSSKSRCDEGYPMHSPDSYFPYFKKHNITTIIRLNAPQYSKESFVAAGFKHFDLIYPDGTTPPAPILERFFDICESSKGAIAIHCKAGLGRTGTLIAAHLMKYNRMTESEAIAWTRINRPGCVIGPQQHFLAKLRRKLWAAGDEYRVNFNASPDEDEGDEDMILSADEESEESGGRGDADLRSISSHSLRSDTVSENEDSGTYETVEMAEIFKDGHMNTASQTDSSNITGRTVYSRRVSPLPMDVDDETSARSSNFEGLKTSVHTRSASKMQISDYDESTSNVSLTKLPATPSGVSVYSINSQEDSLPYSLADRSVSKFDMKLQCFDADFAELERLIEFTDKFEQQNRKQVHTPVTRKDSNSLDILESRTKHDTPTGKALILEDFEIHAKPDNHEDIQTTQGDILNKRKAQRHIRPFGYGNTFGCGLSEGGRKELIKNKVAIDCAHSQAIKNRQEQAKAKRRQKVVENLKPRTVAKKLNKETNQRQYELRSHASPK